MVTPSLCFVSGVENPRLSWGELVKLQNFNIDFDDLQTLFLSQDK